MHIRTIDEAPSVNDYLRTLEHDEACRAFQMVPAGELHLTAGGLLRAAGQCYEMHDAARNDMAKLARIPAPYFETIDAELRAVNFNARLPQFFGREETLEVTTSNDNAIIRVQRRQFGQVRPSLAVQALLEAVPGEIISNDMRVVEYDREGRFDVAVVARDLQTEPNRGDIVCGGVHLTIEANGGVQLGPESFRLVCLNGAMARVCAGGQHRLRRGQGKNSDRNFMATLREFAQTAWRDWGRVTKGLGSLAQQHLERRDIGQIIEGLRRSPFFISARTAGRVEAQLRGNGNDLTFYDLHNALTYVGSHDEDVLPQYRYRLRLGAGQLARGRIGVCRECRRMVIGGDSGKKLPQ